MESRQWYLPDQECPSRESLVHNVAQSFELLEKQKESLIDVFFIRKVFGKYVQYFFHSFGSLTLFPDR